MKMYEAIKLVLGLGLEPKDLTFVQISLRAVVVFVVSVVIIRLANKRFMAKLSAFDTILGFILASMLARAVNGSAAFFPTLLGGFVLIALHRVFAALSFRWEWFGLLVKGQDVILVRDGKIDRERLRRTKISERDLLEEARLNGQVDTVDQIQKATMERSGQVSVIPQKN